MGAYDSKGQYIGIYTGGGVYIENIGLLTFDRYDGKRGQLNIYYTSENCTSDAYASDGTLNPILNSIYQSYTYDPEKQEVFFVDPSQTGEAIIANSFKGFSDENCQKLPGSSLRVARKLISRPVPFTKPHLPLYVKPILK